MSVPKPIVAAINGAVAGMGVPIVLGCDLRFMNENAVITTSFSQRGLVAEFGLSWLLTRLVGPSHALDLLYTARKVKGDEAARIGLVSRALPAEDVLPAAIDYIRDLAIGSSPASMAAMKRQVYRDLNQTLGRGPDRGRRADEGELQPARLPGGREVVPRAPPPGVPPLHRAPDRHPPRRASSPSRRRELVTLGRDERGEDGAPRWRGARRAGRRRGAGRWR